MIKNRIKAIFLGLLALPVRRFIKPQKNLWLFGADQGRKYDQNSRYLYEFILREHPEINAIWVTQSSEVYNMLVLEGKPVVQNISFTGLYLSIKAELKFVSTWFNDILYTFPHQKVVMLHHGMPIKKIFYDNVRSSGIQMTLTERVKNFLSKTILYDYNLEDSCFTPVTSCFYQELMKKAMKNNNVFVVGQPRTDAFLHLDSRAIKNKYGIDENAFIVTYMPTHRSYGAGEPSPHVFIDNKNAIDYFKDHNITIIWKQHINMLKKYKNLPAIDCFKELSFDYSVDPQELLFISDVLITDWSSCFIDFMLLRRPILFYHYDDYERDDNELYYGSDVLSRIGRICKNEDELLSDIKYVFKNGFSSEDMDTWNIFNEFYDDKSCERCFNKLNEIITDK